ncbi:MAG: OPT family oligopeptide transporter [Steroidobacteraceae bacterium]
MNDLRFTPYIAAETQLPEFTVRALLVGAVLGMIFGASSLYLVLKVGLTVSASIPVAVISLTLFRLLSRAGGRDASILENNIAQTAGSAGESIAFGIGVTMPAILILGFELELMRVMLVAATGALLGILMMIPLRRTLIVREHGKLKYPEGTACAEVLKAGASTESRAAASPAAKAEEARGVLQGLSANTIFTGFGIGLAYKTMMAAFKLWKDVPEKVFGAPLAGGSIGVEASPELLGVGYIIGPRIAGVMCAGGVLAYLVMIPMIKLFGESIPGAVTPGTVPISDMSADDIRSAYILYIGAGAVAAAGLISLVRSLPMIIGSLRRGINNGTQRDVVIAGAVLRTEQDISMKYVLVGCLILLVWIVAAPSLNMNIFGAILLLVFGFLFVMVSSRLTGEIGSTSNPISGMTIATLLLTCLIFLALGWTGTEHYVAALSVGGIVCVAASNGGTTSQDLKTGFLVGATPRLQQYAIVIGSLMSVLVLGPILLKLNDTATVYVPAAQVAPAGLHAVANLDSKLESLRGPQARQDQGSYHVWHKRDEQGGPAGKYLVNEQGQAVWLVDPGINGKYNTRPDGTQVRKFDAPKATLMSYIIRGVLDRELPWGLMLLGVMLAIAVEMCGINSLNFSVGVYLPLVTTTPMLLGGILRWWTDRQRTAAAEQRGEDAATIVANADRSSGVLMASGYIAGGAIAGIFIALMAGVFDTTDAKLSAWAQSSNPFYSGAHADALALIPFAILTLILLWAGREPARP